MKISRQALRFGIVSLVLSLASVSFYFATAWSGDKREDKGRFAHGPGMHRMSGSEAPLISIALRHRTDLDLTADQIATLEQIRAQYKDQTRPIRENLRSVEDEIRSLLRETPANLLDIKPKIEESAKLRSELRYLRVEALENGRSVLTEQQRDQLKGLLASRRGFYKPQG